MVLGAKGHVFIGDIPFAIGYEAFQPADGAKMDISQDAGRSQLHFHKGWSTAGGGYFNFRLCIAILPSAEALILTVQAGLLKMRLLPLLPPIRAIFSFLLISLSAPANTFTPTQRMKNYSNRFGRNRQPPVRRPTHLLEVGTGGAWCDGTSWHDGSSRTLKKRHHLLVSGISG